MPRRVPVGNIRRPDDVFEYVAVASTVRLWDHGHDRSLWVHPSVVINILPGYRNISTTIQTPNGEVSMVTMSCSVHFVGVDDSWLDSGVRMICRVIPEWVRDTYREFYLPSYFSQQQDLIWLFSHFIPRDSFPKLVGQWVWRISEVRFEMGNM